jgi:hypothetical protein
VQLSGVAETVAISAVLITEAIFAVLAVLITEAIFAGTVSQVQMS